MHNTAYNFRDSLAVNKAENRVIPPIFDITYKQYFGDNITYTDCWSDRDMQDQGIDRIITLPSGREVTVDEKLRGQNAKTGIVYHDILLEEWSNEEKEYEGWITKPSLCDYIAYAIVPLNICYMLPVLPLQRAWRANADVWKRVYRKVTTANSDTNGDKWTTVSWVIKPSILFGSITDISKVSLVAPMQSQAQRNMARMKASIARLKER